jgi:predicted DNA-binding antitoxin AbrB/MazE fold protein
MRTIEAVYEEGIFRPVEPVSLPEGSRAEVIIPVAASREVGETTETNPKETPYEIMARIAALPGPAHDDGFSGEDHDKILYGENGVS